MARGSINKGHAVRIGGESVENLEVNLIYVLAQSIDQLIRDAERRINAKGRSVKYEMKMRFGQFTQSVKRACILADTLDTDIALLTNSDAKNRGEYDDWHAEANALCRLLLLYEDRLRETKDTDEIFALLDSKPARIVTEEVIKRFTLK